MNVVSVRGGKIHLALPDNPAPFPLCTSGSRNTYTKYRNVSTDVDCKECLGILERRAARLERERAECGANPCCGEYKTEKGCIFK